MYTVPTFHTSDVLNKLKGQKKSLRFKQNWNRNSFRDESRFAVTVTEMYQTQTYVNLYVMASVRMEEYVTGRINAFADLNIKEHFVNKM